MNAEQCMAALLLSSDPHNTVCAHPCISICIHQLLNRPIRSLAQGFVPVRAAHAAWQAITGGSLKKVNLSQHLADLPQTGSGLLAFDYVITKFSTILRAHDLIPDLTAWWAQHSCDPQPRMPSFA